ncbi:MAG TPA: acetyl-CoA hydrolase/transferase C-terminal domain-containing protein [Bryobacteraceae bacterium]
MTWHEESLPGLMNARQALQCVRSGNRIWIEPGCATPTPLVEALVERGAELHDIEIVHMMTLGAAPYTRPEFAGHFRHNGLFLGGNVRQAVQEGRADYTPIFLSEIESLFSSGAMPLDVVLLQCSRPDAHGFVSLGTSVDCTLTAARCARYVIAEVNERMPRTLGDCFVHVSKLSAMVETSRPLLELTPEPYTELQHRIARNVGSLIPDGAVLQIGIGGIPEAVLQCLTDRRDLGIHSEMCSDGVIPLIESGVINGDRKTLHRGKLVVGFVLGTRRLFDFIHENPLFEFRPICYTNDPYIIAQSDNMVAINSALEVDLTGQICSDSIGARPYSGVGGQVDFMRGAARAKGGKPVIALPSTARNGTVSRIVPTLTPGAGVVTSRADVHYIVTEFGVAYLHGKTVRQRAEALIAIAHPNFQEELERSAFEAHHLMPKMALAG